MVDITLHQFTSLLFVTFGCACAPLTRNSRNRFELQPSLVRSFVPSPSFIQISAVTPLRLLLRRRQRRTTDFCSRPLRPITNFERSVMDVIR